MNEPEYIDLEGLVRLTKRLGAGPIRDIGLLDSAAARPRSSVFGQDAYPSLELKAAALLHSICRNHALVDGNKRLAWFAAVAFLALNGHDVTLADDVAFDLVMRVAEGSADVDEIAAILSGASRKR